MRRLITATAIVVALPLTAAADPGYICTGIGTVYEVPESELEFYPDALPVAPTDCPTEVAFIDPDDDVDVPMPTDVDVPMPDDPTGFILDQREWDAAQTPPDPTGPPLVAVFSPELTVRFGAR